MTTIRLSVCREPGSDGLGYIELDPAQIVALGIGDSNALKPCDHEQRIAALERHTHLVQAGLGKEETSLPVMGGKTEQQDARPDAERHEWDDSGERCVKCGDKDWMGGPCHPRAKPDADEAADCCPDEERMRGWSHAEYISHVRHVWSQISALRAECEALRAERDQEISAHELTKEAFAKEEGRAEQAEADRDRLAAELAQARESERRFRAEVEAGFRKHGLAAGPEAIDGLVRDLAAMTERAEKAEADADRLNGLCDHAEARVMALYADAKQQMLAERDAARAAVAELVGLLRQCERRLSAMGSPLASDVKAALAKHGGGT